MFLKQNFITFTLYYFTTYIVIKLMDDPTQAILIWPAAGVGIVTALVWGYKVFPGLYLAQLGISILLYYSSDKTLNLHEFFVSNLFILVVMFRNYFGAYLIKNFVGYPNSLVSFKSIFKFFFIAAPIATLASTLAFDLVKYSLGYIETIAFSKNTLDWWFGDLLGFMIFAPLTMILISQPKSIWKPRFLTVGLPIITILLSVIFIYNKTQAIDNKRAVENLQTTNDIIASKLEQHNNWIQILLDNSLYHILSKGNPEKRLNTFFNSLKDSNNGANAIAWEIEGKIHFVKTSSKYSSSRYAELVKLDMKSLKSKFQTSSIPIYSTRYINELDQFINIFKYTNQEDKYSLTIYIIHDLTEQITSLIDKYKLSQTTVSLKLHKAEQNIVLNKSITRFPEDEIYISSDLKFNNEVWTLINEPTARYIYHNKSGLSSIIAKIGFLFTGLIGIMLLIITGNNTLTKINVQERTLELDSEVKIFKNQKKQYEKLIEQHPVVLWRQNIRTNKITYISKKVEKLYGHPLQNWLNNKDFWIDNIHENDREQVRNTINQSLSNQTPFELEYRFLKSDYSVAWINNVVNINMDEAGNLQLVGLMIDITETKEAKKGQSISESKYRTLFKHAVDALIIIDLDDNTFKDSNDKAIALFGLDNIIGHVSLAEFSTITQPDGSNSRKRLQKIYRQLAQSNYIKFEWVMLNKAHKEIICNIELVKLPEDDHNIALADINDVTEKRHHEKKINQLAYYDNLTKMPNREYFYSKFSYFHELAVLGKKYGTIIYLDLDRFKVLNDSLGHQAGDKLLRMVSERIRSVSKKNDFCARLGGDEFIILTKSLNSSIESTLETSLVKSELILEALNEPYQLDDYEHFITPSIGISVFPSGDESIDQIIHQADIAMYASKEKGKNTITVYQENMVKQVGKRLEIEKAIRQGFDKNEFKLYFQPQFNLNNEINAVEALLRWDRLTELEINTEKLVESIERVGLTHELGYWVFDQACAQLEQWQKQGHSIKSVAVNVSAKQFHRNLFVDQIKSAIGSYDITPSQIVIELTEAIIIEDMVSVISKLNELRGFGVRVSLDDFGTGYSSLAYLKHLPINQLKIDKMFIHDLSFDKPSQHIVKTIIDLARLMEIDLVAEGIELEEQFEILKKIGCKNFQGYYFAKALPAAKLFQQT